MTYTQGIHPLPSPANKGLGSVHVLRTKTHTFFLLPLTSAVLFAFGIALNLCVQIGWGGREDILSLTFNALPRKVYQSGRHGNNVHVLFLEPCRGGWGVRGGHTETDLRGEEAGSWHEKTRSTHLAMDYFLYSGVCSPEVIVYPPFKSTGSSTSIPAMFTGLAALGLSEAFCSETDRCIQTRTGKSPTNTDSSSFLLVPPTQSP